MRSPEVIVPEQVYSEFLRDKEIVYQEFVKSNFIEIKIPGFLKGDNCKLHPTHALARAVGKRKRGHWAGHATLQLVCGPGKCNTTA